MGGLAARLDLGCQPVGIADHLAGLPVDQEQ